MASGRPTFRVFPSDLKAKEIASARNACPVGASGALHRRRVPLVLLAGALVLGACTGLIDEGETSSRSPGVNTPNPNANVPPPVANEPESFNVERTSRVLLPFDVRLARLASVLGVDSDAAVLSSVRSFEADLGGHDFANGISPDLSWNASKMTLWVEVLQPVCASTEMRDQFPELTTATELAALMSSAYGREVATTEAEPLATDLASASYGIRCLTVLSSAEFVLR
ncbi:MAG: hypothetical protein AAGF12_06850 [Myxococcota bacterium]